MIEIRFHPIATEDMRDIYTYHAQFSLQYADSLIEGLLNTIEVLREFPEIGRKYPENELYRQLIYQNYRIIYKFDKQENKIIVMIIVHCSRQLRI
ncbi:MAG: type II toxin-antitoxin system RelE/ParE family toxin [Candidatus Lokiarchaeota archaeon]|nr:type II toxin-antitoxin system RelE/ParE family toxin [Candidatus Lokiarchaeota archaeon]